FFTFGVPAPVVAPPPVAPPPGGGAVTPQAFVDSVTLSGPTAPVPAVDREVSVALTPQSAHPNPAVAIESQITMTPAASMVGGNVSPASPWADASSTGVAYSPQIAVTPGLSVTAQLALVNGPGGLAPSTPIAPVTFTIDDQRLTNMATSWQPGIEFNNGQFQDTFIPGTSTPAYLGGAQTIGVKGTMPAAPNLNPGLTLNVRARIERSGAIIGATQTTSYPANAAESTVMTFSISAPATVPATGDALDIITELVDATGTVVASSARTTPMSIGPEVTYTQAAAETAWNDDETHLHGAFITHLASGTGPAAGLAGLIRTTANPTGPVDIHPMVQRHDSAAYVAADNGGIPDPSRSAYVISTPPYAPHPDPNTLVIATGAGGWSIGGHPPYPGSFVLLNRTSDVASGAKASDDTLQIIAIHEAVHEMDRGNGGTPWDQYTAEFRAYWMDGRFGDPLVASSGDPAEYDPDIPAPGPKSARANRIFRLQYDEPILYPYCKPNYDANTNGFREQVDSYLHPDGVNLNLSAPVEALRAHFVAGVGGSFATFRTGVQAFFGTGAPPPGGVLSADDQSYIAGSRTWRDLVDNLAGASGAQKATLKSDMGIP
ncbi:MAG: hypothetical protein K8M05_35255, partial [Deltaproteobacteria bacterium]|nr:hypothetical protein [Kofleriaceae bacterium]